MKFKFNAFNRKVIRNARNEICMELGKKKKERKKGRDSSQIIKIMKEFFSFVYSKLNLKEKKPH